MDLSGLKCAHSSGACPPKKKFSWIKKPTRAPITADKMLIGDLPLEIASVILQKMPPEQQIVSRSCWRENVPMWCRHGPQPQDCVRSRVYTSSGSKCLGCDLTVWEATSQWAASCRQAAVTMASDHSQIPLLLSQAKCKLDLILQTWPSKHLPPDMQLICARAALLQRGESWMVIPEVFRERTDKAALEVQLSMSSEYTGDMHRIHILEGVTRIDDGAFRGCQMLQEVIVPQSVVSIGVNAFSGCKELQSISLPPGVSYVGPFAFYNCFELRSIVIPESVATIDTGTFYGCRELRQVTIPSSVTRIGRSAFYMCTQLRNIDLPDSVTAIEACVFLMCTELRLIVIPEGVTEIANHTFQDCGKLQSVHIKGGITKIGAGAFIGCRELQTVTVGIPETPTTVGQYAFHDCGKLCEGHAPGPT